MARSMIQLRQDAERQRIEAYQASLQRVSAAPRPAPDFERALDEARRGYAGVAIRDGPLWRPKLKTRDPARLRLAAARHLYALLSGSGRARAPSGWTASGLDARRRSRCARRWYIAAAGGESLYKAGASEWLSRKEVHCFLNVSGESRLPTRRSGSRSRGPTPAIRGLAARALRAPRSRARRAASSPSGVRWRASSASNAGVEGGDRRSLRLSRRHAPARHRRTA